MFFYNFIWICLRHYTVRFSKTVKRRVSWLHSSKDQIPEITFDLYTHRSSASHLSKLHNVTIHLSLLIQLLTSQTSLFWLWHTAQDWKCIWFCVSQLLKHCQTFYPCCLDVTRWQLRVGYSSGSVKLDELHQKHKKDQKRKHYLKMNTSSFVQQKSIKIVATVCDVTVMSSFSSVPLVLKTHWLNVAAAMFTFIEPQIW